MAKYCFPVLRSRQRNCRLSPNPVFRQRLSCSCRDRLAFEKTVHSRAGTRKRGILRPSLFQCPFDLTYGGMLRENDTFEVVFDPGTDKVEKQRLGPVPAFAWDTGWGKPSTAQPLKHSMAELIHSIGAVR